MSGSPNCRITSYSNDWLMSKDSKDLSIIWWLTGGPPQDHNLAVELGIRSRALIRRRGHVKRKELIGWRHQDLIFNLGRWHFLLRRGTGPLLVSANNKTVYHCNYEDQDDPGRIEQQELAETLLTELKAFMLLEDIASI